MDSIASLTFLYLISMYISWFHVSHAALWLKMWAKMLPVLCRRWFPGWGGEHFMSLHSCFTGESRTRQVISAVNNSGFMLL